MKYDIKKYKDRSIGLVDYVLLKENKDIKLPVASFGFSDPFSYQKLKDIGPNVTKTFYTYHLFGDTQGDEYDKIDYQNVVLKPNDYFLSGYQLKSNETPLDNYEMFTTIEYFQSNQLLSQKNQFHIQSTLLQHHHFVFQF